MGDSFSYIQRKFIECNYRDIVDKMMIIINRDFMVKVFGSSIGDDELNGLIGYCYIDYTEGISFQPCAAICSGDDWLRLAELPDRETMYVFRFRDNEFSNIYEQGGRVMKLYNIPEDALLMNPEDLDFDMAMFEPFIDRFSTYIPSEDVLRIRELKHLDEFRNELYPDDVRVLLYREDKDIEQVWVRTMFLEEHTIFGKLLNEPYGDLDFHEGEIIEFQMVQVGEHSEERLLVSTGRKAIVC